MDREARHVVVVVASRGGNRHDARRCAVRRSWISLANFQTRRISPPYTPPFVPFPQEKLRLPKVLILFPCGSPTSSLLHVLSFSFWFPWPPRFSECLTIPRMLHSHPFLERSSIDSCWFGSPSLSTRSASFEFSLHHFADGECLHSSVQAVRYCSMWKGLGFCSSILG